MNENTNIAHTNTGIRLSVMPGARSLKIVTMKLIAPTVVEMPTKITAKPQKSMLMPSEYGFDVRGVYANQPPSGACPMTKLAKNSSPENKKIQ